ncbi:MAG: hypothetical protein ABIP10_19390 [Ferruginibacter sp.]
MKRMIIKTMTLVAISATLFSFTNLGGEGFEISLNNKVVVQHYGKPDNAPKSFRLNSYSANDQLSVKYHHCGKVGKNRVLTIKDKQNKILKEWRFADVTVPVAPMSCNVKDILSLGKTNESELKLYYTSSELPDGRMLAIIIVENNIVAKNK